MKRDRSIASFLIESLEFRTLLSSANYDFLSDLPMISSSNGYGPVERDQSNGFQAAGDGTPIMIHGNYYRKGLGVHADAEIHYKLGGNYKSFVSDIGLDDETHGKGSVDFQVFADGEKLYDSGVITAADRTKRINVDVSGMNELVLIVTDGGDDNVYDHADFAGARLIRPTGDAPTVMVPASAALDETQPFFNASGSFSDLGAGPWSGTVDWGDGSRREYVTLGDDNSFSLFHQYTTHTDSTYQVTVRVNNGNAVGIGRSQVTFNDLPPANVGLVGNANSDGSFSAFAGLTFGATGVFTDPGAGEGDKFVATVDYGDGTPVANVSVGSRFFAASHVYSQPGIYTVTSTVTDSGGETGVGTNTINVTAPNYTYLSDLSSTVVSGTTAKDRATGGTALMINGGRYTKGLGVTGDSEIVFNVGRSYKNLIADVGVDDAAGSDASLDFKVYADGNLVFDSGTMIDGSAAKRMNLNVSGVNEVRLVVSRTGTHANSTDRGDWAGIRLVN